MNEEQKKLLEALWVIKAECVEYPRCEGCPLRGKNDSICLVQDSNPGNWDLKPLREEEKPWSAFN